MYVDDDKEVFLGKTKKKGKRPWKIQYRYHYSFMKSDSWGNCSSYETEKQARQAMKQFKKNRVHNWGDGRQEKFVDEPLKEGVYEHFSVWLRGEKQKEFRLVKDE